MPLNYVKNNKHYSAVQMFQPVDLKGNLIHDTGAPAGHSSEALEAGPLSALFGIRELGYLEHKVLVTCQGS